MCILCKLTHFTYCFVFTSCLGQDLRQSSHSNLVLALVEQICTRPVLWEKATAFKPVTHFIDFGPGGLSGVGSLIHRNKNGSGIQVILATVLADHLNQELIGRVALLDSRPASLRFGPNWAQEHHPKLVRIG
jgi:fatty acid synthase subunit beta